jgi:hypothetical protein
MTSTQRKQMQEFRATLPDELKGAFDRMVEAQGEDRVFSQLGHLRQQLEYVQSL